jgi:hypothetical protein
MWDFRGVRIMSRLSLLSLVALNTQHFSATSSIAQCPQLHQSRSTSPYSQPSRTGWFQVLSPPEPDNHHGFYSRGVLDMVQRRYLGRGDEIVCLENISSDWMQQVTNSLVFLAPRAE